MRALSCLQVTKNSEVHTFFLHNVLSFEPKLAHALGHYRPYYVKGEDGEKIRNPQFDAHSQQVLNLKSPDRRQYFDPAVRYCSGVLRQFLQKQNFGAAEILIIPSSKKGQVSQGLEKVVQNICRTDRRVVYVPGGLTRDKTIEKLATGGDRSVQIHLDSMSYHPRPGSPGFKIVLDDVSTSGNSLAAACTLIGQYGMGATTLPLVFGRTTHD